MNRLTRREFLKVSVSTSSGLLVSISLPAGANNNQTSKNTHNGFQANAWIQISPENIVTVNVAESEMGQGVMTSLPMLVAEELEMPLSSVKFSRAPLGPAFGYQSTGGSSSVREAWPTLRKAAATTRELLVRAASQQWQVPRTECFAEAGSVRHRGSSRLAPYSNLFSTAEKLPTPENVTLKSPEDFNVIGKSTATLDAPLKVTGKAIYGTDIILPDMLFASIQHCPVFGGTLDALDESNAKNIPGVKQVVKISSGVAVVADNTWAAQKGLQALNIQWDLGKHTQVSSQSIQQDYQNALSDSGETLARHGDAAAAAVKNTVGEKKLTASYTFPFVAHATMEPMCCTAYVHDNECDVWAPTQTPSAAQKVAAKYALPRHLQILEKIKNKITGNALQQIRIHTTFLGGGFGRRLEQDYVAEAVQISRAVEKPIKLIWSREEDIQHDYYRPLTHHYIQGGIDNTGKPSFWLHRIVGESKGKSTLGATMLPYDVVNFKLDFIQRSSPVPIGNWRSVGHAHNAFVIETFIDELATLADENPLDYRLQWSNSSQLKNTLKLAAQKSGWGQKLAPGHFHGLAAHKSFGSYVAQVAEISVSTTQEIIVHKVTCCIDCGIAVNPNTIKAQVEGSIIFGLTACLKSAVELKDGRIRQSNFHDFPLLRISEAPEIETHIITSAAAPTGVGEPAVPPIAPAIANAVYAAIGKRVRRLPIRPKYLQTS